jgi:DNA polymerase-3 subunit epsilon
MDQRYIRPFLAQERQRIAASCHAIVTRQADGVCILDTETTGMQGEIIDLCILSVDGRVLFDSLIKPICAVEAAATKLHGIDESMLRDAPAFVEIWPQIFTVLQPFKTIYTYNAKFDSERLVHTGMVNGIGIQARYGIHQRIHPEIQYVVPAIWHCLMRLYALYWGEEDPRFATPTFQSLSNACIQQDIQHSNWHRAKGDAQAALKLLHKLASRYDPKNYPQQQHAGRQP